MISKELLSEVLKLKGISEIRISDNHIIFRYVDITHDRTFQINIYELAHKCKEWAFSKNYIISSELHSHSARVAIYDDDGLVLVNNNNDCIIESTEPEAIFQACQYILDKMEKVLDFLKENDMYADFGEDIIIFSKKNDEVFFIGTLDETLNFIEHYN